MSEQLTFDYYYGMEAEQFAYYRIPKLLIQDKRFSKVSNDAKLLYGLFLDRMSLSVKNGWLDEDDRVYIYYTYEDIMQDLGLGHTKICQIIAELDTKKGIGLIERKKQGLGRPDKIYVKNFVKILSEPEEETEDEAWKSRLPKYGTQDFRKTEVKTSEIRNSGHPENGTLDFRKTETNNTDINNTELSNTESNETELNETENVFPSVCHSISPQAQPVEEKRQTDRKTDRRVPVIIDPKKRFTDDDYYRLKAELENSRGIAFEDSKDIPRMTEYISYMSGWVDVMQGKHYSGEYQKVYMLSVECLVEMVSAGKNENYNGISVSPHLVTDWINRFYREATNPVTCLEVYMDGVINRYIEKQKTEPILYPKKYMKGILWSFFSTCQAQWDAYVERTMHDDNNKEIFK